MTKAIKLGDIARCKVTGFEGVVIAHGTYRNNCPRWTLQPQEKKDGKPIESRSVDSPDCEFVKTTKLAVIPCSRPKDPVQLDDMVRDEVTGLKGRVECIYTFLAGCVRVAVNPCELKDGIPVQSTFLDEIHLTVTKRAKPAPVVKTGGPRSEPAR